MIRPSRLSPALLSIFWLMSSVAALAQTGETFVPIPRSAIRTNAVTSAINQSQIVNVWASPIDTAGNDGYKDKDQNQRGPSPAPEPSRILSFGAALLIGGGVLYSRRLRRNSK
jgi:hypothetical protein